MSLEPCTTMSGWCLFVCLYGFLGFKLRSFCLQGKHLTNVSYLSGTQPCYNLLSQDLTVQPGLRLNAMARLALSSLSSCLIILRAGIIIVWPSQLSYEAHLPQLFQASCPICPVPCSYLHPCTHLALCWSSWGCQHPFWTKKSCAVPPCAFHDS